MISVLLKHWRRMEGLSIREAAERIGIDRNALYRLENEEPINQRSLGIVLRWLWPVE